MAGRIRSIREALAACFMANQGSLTKGQVLAWVGDNYPGNDFNTNTLQQQLYRSCRNLESAQKSSAPKIIIYDKSSRTYRRVPSDYLDSSEEFIDDVVVSEEADPGASSKFALEAHLRDYLSRNLFLLEKGLELWSSDPPSVEYALEGRRIDILAKDQHGVPVVIELKLSKGHERTLGQALYYRGKLKQVLCLPRVRIIMVAAEITEELGLASTEVPDVEAFSYKLTMQVEKIDLSNQEGS